MAIAFNAVTNSPDVNTPTGETVAHTTSGSNRCLIVHIMCGGADPVSNYSSLAVTYNGVSMSNEVDITAGQRRSVIFSLINPASGSNNVVLSWGGGGTELAYSIVSYTGVDQTDCVEATNTANFTIDTANPSIGITTVSDNAWLVGNFFFRDSAATSFTTDSGNNRWTIAGSGAIGASDRGPVASAGVTTLAWTLSGGTTGTSPSSIVVAALKPGPDDPDPTGNMFLVM